MSDKEKTAAEEPEKVEVKTESDPEERLKKLLADVKGQMKNDEHTTTPDPGKKENTDKAIAALTAELEAVKAQLAEREQKKAPEPAEHKGRYPDPENKSGGWSLSYKQMLEVDAPTEEVKRIQQLNDDVYLAMCLMGNPIQGPRHPDTFQHPQLKAWAAELKVRSETKATGPLYSTLAGSGDEWVPTGWSNEIFKTMELFGTVEQIFKQIKMPRDPYKIGVQTARAIAYIHTEPTANAPSKYTASAMATDDVTLTTKLLAVRTVFSDIYDEDALVAQLPTIKQDLAKALVYGVEQAILDGDDNGTHQDTGDAPTNPDVRVAWDGLRFFARNVEDSGGTATKLDGAAAILTHTLMNKVALAMGKYAARPTSELAWIMGPKTYIGLLRDTNVLTMEKYGPKATILTGELAKMSGIPVVVTELAREDLNSDGIYDGSTKTRSCPILVNHRQFVLGSRRDIKIDSQRIFGTDASEVIATRRAHFMPMEDVILDVSGSSTSAHGVTPVGCVYEINPAA